LLCDMLVCRAPFWWALPLSVGGWQMRPGSYELRGFVTRTPRASFNVALEVWSSRTTY